MKNFKIEKILLIFLLAVIFLIPSGAYAVEEVRVVLEGNELKFDVPPQIIEGRTMLPLRVIFESLGLEVGWDNETKIITGITEGKTIVLRVGDNNASVNGAVKNLDVPPLIVNGRTLVPVRFIAESLDMKVDWVQDTKTVIINRDDGVITFKDPNFELAVRAAVKKASGDIYKSDVESITFLFLGKEPTNTALTKVNDLEGIQHFVNLKELMINENNTISDLSPIKNLINLETLTIFSSEIESLEPLKGLHNLETLRVMNSKIIDIPYLGNLGKLKVFNLVNNNITNISSIRNISNLEYLSLNDNPVISIESLKEMKNLKGITIPNTKVTDLSPLLDLPDLESINVSDIPISKIDLAKVYQILTKKGVEVSTSYDEDALLNIEISNNTTSIDKDEDESKDLLRIDDYSTPYEISEYLRENFGSLKTVIGTTHFDFSISENTTTIFPYDYWIQVKYEYEFFGGAMYSNKYTNEQKNTLRRELKEHQRDIGESLIELLPNKKLYGGYFDSWYRYPNLRVDLITRRYYSWTNYEEPDFLSNISDYEQTKPSYFRWYDLIDDDL